MIASLLLKYGIPMWMVKLVLAAALASGAVAYHHHVYKQGEDAANARATAREKANSDLADAELKKINAKLAQKQIELTAAIADLARLQKENDDEKINSAALQSDLLAGRKRLSVLVRQRPADPTQPPDNSCPAQVDSGATVSADLAERPAAAIEWLRSTREEAINRLDACVAAYDSSRKAVNDIAKDN